MPDPSDWLQRVKEEKADLDAKAERLRLFTGSAAFRALEGQDVFLLGQQLALMDQYSTVLGKRIKRGEDKGTIIEGSFIDPTAPRPISVTPIE